MFCVLRTDPLRTAYCLSPLHTAYQSGVTLNYDFIDYYRCCMRAFELKLLRFEWKINAFMNMPEKRAEKNVLLLVGDWTCTLDSLKRDKDLSITPRRHFDLCSNKANIHNWHDVLCSDKCGKSCYVKIACARVARKRYTRRFSVLNGPNDVRYDVSQLPTFCHDQTSF